MSSSNVKNGSDTSDQPILSFARKEIQLDLFIKDIFAPLIQVIDDILDSESKNMICRNYADSIVESGAESLALLFCSNIKGEFLSNLFEHLLIDLPDDKFKEIFYVIKGMYDVAIFEGGKDISSIEKIKQIYQYLLNSEKGKQTLSNRKEMVDSLKIGLKSLLEGNMEVFRNKHFIHSLPEALAQLFSRGKEKPAETIIEKFITGLRSENIQIRKDIAQALSLIISSLISENRYETFYRISPYLTEWIISETEEIPSLPIIYSQLQVLVQHLLQYNRYEDTIPIMKVFYDIVIGKYQKNVGIQNLARQILKGIAQEDLLDLLMNEFLTDEENKRRAASDCLVLLGAESAPRLLNALRESDSRYERSRILLVLSDIGSLALPSIIDSFNLGEPWYFIRNLVLLVGRLGNKSHLPVLRPMLTYGDIRVQREAITSIYNIAGIESEDIFLSVLPDADDRLKMDIIDVLVTMKSEKAVPVLTDMLKNGFASASSTMRNDLAAKVCVALGIIGSEKTAMVLQDVIAQKHIAKGGKPYDEKVISAAVNALTQVSQKKEKKTKILKSEEKVTSQQEKFIEQYLSRWNNDDTVEEYAVNILLELILKYVSDKDFERAIAFRNKLIQIDPMAKREIQIADEFINKGKKEISKNRHFTQWANLYSLLTEEEANILFNTLVIKEFEPKQTVYQQGQLNRFLYFIDTGELKIVFYRNNNEELFVKEVSAGGIAGEDSFFPISFCTTTALTVSDVTAYILDKDIFLKWKENYPSLASKLTSYCLKTESIYMILKRNGIDRRNWDRKIYTDEIFAKIINDTRIPPIKGTLLNVSPGGLSFSGAIPNKIARNLLGQELNLQYHLRSNLLKNDRNGTVVAVFEQSSDIYSLHVKFDTIIEEPPIDKSQKTQKVSQKDSFLVTKW